MNHPLEVFVLTRLVITSAGQVVSKNMGVTFDLYAADAHRARSVENDFERYPIPMDWLEEAEQSSVVSAMRWFREMVEAMQREALR